MESSHDPNRIVFANDLRGLAALTVLIGHYLHHAWFLRPVIANLAGVRLPTETEVPTPALAQWVSSIPSFDWGAYGVAVFFLVSGFVIPISLMKYNVPGFLVGRLFRIWPTYIAGFSVTLLSLYLAGHYFGHQFPFSLKQVAVHYLPGLRDTLWSVNIDGVIWTLEIEVKFYVVCAVLAQAVRRRSALLFVAPAIIGVACYLATGYMDTHGLASRMSQLVGALTLSGQFIVFMFIGTVVAFAMSRSMTRNAAWIIGVTLLAEFVGLALAGPWRAMTLPLGSYFAALITFLVAAAFWRPKKQYASLRFLSEVSYPLYAAHGVMGYGIIAVALQIGAPPLAAVSVAALAALLVAWTIHRLVEAPTHRIGQQLARAATRTSAESQVQRTRPIAGA